MFQTLLTADLPSEEQQGNAPQDPSWVKAHDRVSFRAGRLLQMLQRVFVAAGVTDATMVHIDGRTIYADQGEKDDSDLDQLVVRAQDEGFLSAGFHELLLGLSCWEDGVQHILLAQVLTSVPVGEHELQIRIASRPDDLNARRLDSPVRYHQRLVDYAGGLTHIEGWRAKAQGLAGRLTQSLHRALPNQDVVQGITRLQVVRPSSGALLEMTKLAWGDPIQAPRYTLRPLHHRTHRVADVALDVYDDPFLAFRHWSFLQAILVHKHLRFEWVHVVTPMGEPLFAGHKAGWFEAWPWGKRHRIEPKERVVDVVIDAA